ncbi:alpha-L-rhamnosidase-related protein [Cohnella fermenti]|uniref:Alpha-L-rhamnosidase six-hairpin glycosidase domain-containing protein n=1 Tax=Cohnella fermenti TaxID=2565925 RepID=A0A4S4BNE8_9BACL|nr:family 78 glycoside hydrolase catalytic domain [Cohnella fermenti]THF76206.1 hypothetical protein E6C55_19440 [Cohnella fermenti]
MLNAPCLQHPALSREVNVYVLFQGRFRLDQAGRCKIRLFSCGPYRLYMNGEEIGEGPARFTVDHPEYDTYEPMLEAGEQTVSAVVHHYGIDNRMFIPDLPHFLQCEASDDSGSLTVSWRALELDAYRHLGRRVNGQLGWAECCDTNRLPDLSRPLDDAVAAVVEPVVVRHPLGEGTRTLPKQIRDCLQLPVASVVIGQGVYANRFGYEDDDPPVRFLSRDLRPELPADGIWMRFDLGRIGLHRPRIVIEAPRGAIIEAGYAESLTDGRVYPLIPLSASSSCHLDRWVASGGRQTLRTFSPRGFRFMEVHIAFIAAGTAGARIVHADAELRTLYDRPLGSFDSDDALLNRIWELGADTVRACCEDALIDTPTRERGQWIGDAAVIGLEALGVTFGDTSLIRRALEQASACRRADGPAAGLCPGQDTYLTTYSLYWVQSCLREASLTGDRRLLHEGLETAERTIDYFWRHWTPRGIAGLDIWDFLDWGHLVGDGEVNVSLNLVLLNALRDLIDWERELGRGDLAEQRERQAAELQGVICEHYRTEDGLLAKSVPLAGGNAISARKPGYHATVLGLLNGCCDDRDCAVAFVKAHMLRCFPNDAAAPRLAHPGANNDRLITPSFAHFSLQALWEAGEAEFALEQYRTCWGWMLDQGLTTLAEVFDVRWSHCHAWSAAPTWQLSRYALGLLPEPERGANCFRLLLQPGSLERAAGTVPLLGGDAADAVRIAWSRQADGSVRCELTTDRAIRVRLQPSANQQVDSASTMNGEGWDVPAGGKLELNFRF